MSECSDSRSFSRAVLVRNETIAEDIFELEFRWTGPAPQSGQFFLIKPIRSGVFLGRAISVFGWNRDKCDPGKASSSGSLRFLIARRGRGTAELADLRVGEESELSGPLGNAWPRPVATNGGSGHGGVVDQRFAAALKEKPLALVGGGIGIAPLVYFARELPLGNYDFFAGFRSISYGLEEIAPRNLILATDDGSEGRSGRVPDFLEPSAYGAVYACGPEPMLRAVAAKCAATRTPCLLSLERRMACGVGACLGCAVPTLSGNRRCCVDGPIFDAEEIAFDD